MDAGVQGSLDAQAAFADAVARARQIAAKINQPGAGGGDAAPSMKRPFESDGNSFGEPELKKTAAAINDHIDPNSSENCAAIGAQLKALQDQQSRSEAAQAAKAAAARINQQLGVSPPAGAPQAPNPKPGPHAGLGMVVTEEYSVPDKMVGLIIGKGGEQITRLQAETGCKIQIAADSAGMPERPCTLTGSAASISACKQQIQDIIHRGQTSTMPGGMGMPDPMGMGGGGGGGGGGEQNVVEIMVPGNKVGLVIGKGGETIKQLQERANVKMVMIQDSNIPSAHEKPLRISGDPQKCQRAKEMVMDLLTEKELEGMQKGGFGNNDYGSPGGGFGGPPMEVPVPRAAVGIVIGKGGEMIKKIQQETGAKVQFKPDDGNSADRMCAISGAPDKVQNAASMIQSMIQDFVRDGPGGMGRGFGAGRGRGGPGGGRGRGGGPFGGGPGRGMGRGDSFGGGFQDETTFAVPADKCGLVIGKGGETIRQINTQSGAHVELQRQPGPNPNEKIFNIRGEPQQIQHAIQLISEKAGISLGGGGPGGHGGPGGPGGPGPHGGPGGPGGGGGGGTPTGYNDQFGGQFGGPGQQPPPGQYSGGPQGGWGGYNQQQGGYPQQQTSDPNAGGESGTKQAQDHAAAWAAYYAQYYAQYGAYGGGQYGQQQGQQQAPQAQQQAQQPQQQQAVNTATGQPDYSAAWAEYYRQQGMHYQANLILQQAQQAQAAGGQVAPQSQPPQ